MRCLHQIFRTCCNKSNMDWEDFMKIPGCATGFHTDIKLVRPTVQKQEDSSAPIPIQSPSPLPIPIPIPTESKPELQAAEQVPFITPSGFYKCRHAGCMKEYDPKSEETCTYHEGSAGFRDGKKFWSCCNASSYDWDDFMKIPKCKEGPHEPKMVNAS